MAKNSVDAIRQLRSPYTVEDVYTALRTLAFFGGNLRRATAALNDAGIQVSKRTLERWSQQQFPEAYAEAQAECTARRGRTRSAGPSRCWLARASRWGV